MQTNQGENGIEKERSVSFYFLLKKKVFIIKKCKVCESVHKSGVATVTDKQTNIPLAPQENNKEKEKKSKQTNQKRLNAVN